MRQIGFWGFTSLFFPFATALAAPGASSVPDEIQGHPYKRLIGSLIEVECWKGFMPRSKVFNVWKREPVDDWFYRDIWLATTVGRTELDLKTALTLEDDTYKHISTEADRYQFDCNRNRARVIERVRTSGPFKTGEVVFRSTVAEGLPFGGEWIPFDTDRVHRQWLLTTPDSEYLVPKIEILWEETCGRARRIYYVDGWLELLERTRGKGRLVYSRLRETSGAAFFVLHYDLLQFSQQKLEAYRSVFFPFFVTESLKKK